MPYGTPPPPTTATLAGQVTCLYDNSPVVGATVQIGSYSGTSGSDGRYSIPSIPFGSYTATVSKANYETFTTSVTLPSGQSAVTQDFSLTPFSDFIYTTSANTLTVVGYRGAGGAVTIPSSDCGGLPVVAIGDEAFLNNRSYPKSKI